MGQARVRLARQDWLRALVFAVAFFFVDAAPAVGWHGWPLPGTTVAAAAVGAVVIAALLLGGAVLHQQHRRERERDNH